jgi:hypothetical protein
MGTLRARNNPRRNLPSNGKGRTLGRFRLNDIYTDLRYPPQHPPRRYVRSSGILHHDPPNEPRVVAR